MNTEQIKRNAMINRLLQLTEQRENYHLYVTEQLKVSARTSDIPILKTHLESQSPITRTIAYEVLEHLGCNLSPHTRTSSHHIRWPFIAATTILLIILAFSYLG